MKTNQNTIFLGQFKGLNILYFLGLMNYFHTLKRGEGFDIFQYLKSKNEKLQIVYANLRV